MSRTKGNLAFDHATKSLDILANRHRLVILNLLEKRDYSPEELAIECRLDLSLISQHLSLLQRSGFITNFGEGNSIRFKVKEQRINELLKSMQKKSLG